MSYLVILWGALYFAFIIYLIMGWRTTLDTWYQGDELGQVTDATGAELPTVTVVIPVRNEAQNLPLLLADLWVQSYPANLVRIVVVDDASTDGTPDLVRRLALTQDGRLQLITQPELVEPLQFGPKANENADNTTIHLGLMLSAKKRAIMAAISTTTADIILTTDGDCRVPPSWIITMVKTMRNQGAVAVSGPVTLTGTSRFAQLQSMEFGSLVVTGGATLGHGWATMCNGANLGYYRHAFVKVRGYEGVEHQPSGDDEFLWHRLAAHYPGQLAFAPTSGALVRTAAATTWHQFVQQRTRWASKWDQYDGLAYSLLAAGLGLWHFGTLVLIGLAFVGTISWAQLAIFLSNKLLADCLLLLPTYQQLGIRWRTSAFMIVGLGYPFYAAYFAFRTLLGRGFEWKGRTY